MLMELTWSKLVSLRLVRSVTSVHGRLLNPLLGGHRRMTLCLTSSSCHLNQPNRYLATKADEPEEGPCNRIPKPWLSKLKFNKPIFNWEYLCNPQNTADIEKNIVNRKGVGNIHQVQKLWKAHQDSSEAKHKEELEQELITAALDIPNCSHPDAPVGDESCARLVDVFGFKRNFDFRPKSVVELGEDLDMLRTENVTITTGTKSYYFKGDLVRLERALIRYTIKHLIAQGFQLMTVPDMLHPAVIEGCGFKTTGERTQVYRLDPEAHGNVCMAGTSEMSLAGYFIDKDLDNKDLPLKLAAVSRCYRAEAPDHEQGIYRVHQFTKVEMFVVTSEECGLSGAQMLEELVALEIKLFTELGLHFRILDMPTQELGAPAHRKFDIEAWMPANGFWGEISSASNCSDYQSRRLNIQYQNSAGKLQYATTVNGTACAVPRMIMAIFENFQEPDGSVTIPEPLRKYMDGQKKLTRPERSPNMKWIKVNKIRNNL